MTMRLSFIPRRGSGHLGLFVLMTLFAPLPCLAQTSLTLSSNGFRDGDSLVITLVRVGSAGTIGRNVVWDFSDKGIGRAHVLLYT